MTSFRGSLAEQSFKATDDVYYAVNPHTLTNYRAGYLNLWSKATVKADQAATRWASKIIAHKATYQDIAKATGVPWWVIGCLHMRENGCNFKGVLHNGELIIGTGRKTRLVPKGRGPFSSFKQAAIDALKDYKVRVWDVAAVAYIMEKFNGFGYRNKGIPSPYLWGGSSVQQRGKYIRDGVYDAGTWDPQLGGMTVLKRLSELDRSVADEIKSPAATKTGPTVTPGAPIAAVTGIVSTIAYYADLSLPYILGAGALAFAALAAWEIYKKMKSK